MSFHNNHGYALSQRKAAYLSTIITLNGGECPSLVNIPHDCDVISIV